MIDQRESLPPFKRAITCEHCGGERPWAWREWLFIDGFHFCSDYCKTNYDAFVLKMWRKGKGIKTA